MGDTKAPAEKFIIPAAWRERCEILHLNAEKKADFFPLHMDFIKCLLTVESIDFILYFAAGWDMVEFIRPREFSHELVKEMILAHKQNPAQTRICIKKADRERYDKKVAVYMREKFVAAASGAAMTHAAAYKIYSGFSEASQRIARGSMDEECYNQMSRTCSASLGAICSTKDTVEFLAAIVGKEPALYDHGAVTAMISLTIAWNTLKLQKRESKLTAQAALLHDVERYCSYLGKAPDRTQISQSAIKELIAIKEKGVGFHDTSIETMQQFREHFDGTGMPRKLKGAVEDGQSLAGISRTARIVSIGCAFSEYMLKRQEKLPLTLATIMKLLKERADKGEFDPQIVNQFIKDAASGTLRKMVDETHSADDDDDEEYEEM